jgi:hypothetical protein
MCDYLLIFYIIFQFIILIGTFISLIVGTMAIVDVGGGG